MTVKFGKQTVHALLDKDSRGNYIQVSSIDDKMWSLDIRQMFTTEDGEIKPTTKGIRANEELVVDLLVECMKALPEDLFDEVMERIDNENAEG